jgi:hypothetical protein
MIATSLLRENIVMLAALASVDVPAIWDNVTHFRISGHAALISAVCSVLGAIILVHFLGNFGNITYPLNFATLFIGTVIANCAFDGVHVPSLAYPEKVLIITLAGMIATSVGMLYMMGTQRR